MWKGLGWMLDFEERLADYLDSLKLGYTLYYDSNDSTSDESSMAVISAAGSKTITTYYDGTKEKLFNYFVQINDRAQNRTKAMEALKTIAGKVEDLYELPSSNGSYEFNNITISNEPYFTLATDDGSTYFRLSIQAELTIFEEEV